MEEADRIAVELLSPGITPAMGALMEAMSFDGLIIAMTIEAPTDREVFLGYLEEALCSRLKPGRIVVMDNLSSHEVPGVSDLIHAAGAELLYLPPYSPDFNPIEKCWSKLKRKSRTLKAGSLDALEAAIEQALPDISRTTLRHGSDTAVMVYSIMKYDLER